VVIIWHRGERCMRRKYEDNDSYGIGGEKEVNYPLATRNDYSSRYVPVSSKTDEMQYGYYDNYDRNIYITEGNSYFDNEQYYNADEYYSFNNGDYINYEYGYDRSYVYDDYYGNSQFKNNYNNEDDYDENIRLKQLYQSYSNDLGIVDDTNNVYGNDLQNSKKDGLYNKKGNDKSPEKINYEDMFVVSSKYFEEDDDEKLISLKDVINLFVCVIMAIILAFMLVTYVVHNTHVDGTSMEFNYHNEDMLLIDKISYRLKKPERFDVVTFPVENGEYYIKRIIGLPGEKVLVTDKYYKNESMRSKIFINGEELKDDVYGFCKELAWGTSNGNEQKGENSEITLGEDEYFVMGDNRNGSSDSRRKAVGNLKKDKIIGKVLFRVYPFDRFGFVEDKDNYDIKYNNDTEKAVDNRVKEKGEDVYKTYTLEDATEKE